MGYTFRLCPSTGGQAWNKVTLMEEINRFVSLAASGRFTVTELCADFHVSRKTGYKWLRRYEAEADGRQDRINPSRSAP